MKDLITYLYEKLVFAGHLKRRYLSTLGMILSRPDARKPRKSERKKECLLNIAEVSPKSSLSLFCQGALSGPKSSYLTDRVSTASQPFKLTLWVSTLRYTYHWSLNSLVSDFWLDAHARRNKDCKSWQKPTTSVHHTIQHTARREREGWSWLDLYFDVIQGRDESGTELMSWNTSLEDSPPAERFSVLQSPVLSNAQLATANYYNNYVFLILPPMSNHQAICRCFLKVSALVRWIVSLSHGYKLSRVYTEASFHICERY